MNAYVLGRLAVIKEYRGKNLGSVIVKEAEQYIKKIGGICNRYIVIIKNNDMYSRFIYIIKFVRKTLLVYKYFCSDFFCIVGNTASFNARR